MIERGFWRGFLPLLFMIAAVRLSQQVDIAMIARTKAHGGPAAYAMVAQIAIIELSMAMALASVVVITVARAARDANAAPIIGQITTTVFFIGALVGGAGIVCYPRIVDALPVDPEIVTLVRSSVLWYSLGCPLRFLVTSANFSLYALGDGSTVTKWKAFEITLKVIANFICMDTLGLGFAGCFVAGVIVNGISVVWCWRRLRIHHADYMLLPGRSWAAGFLKATGFEAYRICCGQLAAFASFALFAAPWLGGDHLSRLDAYAAGTMLVLLLHSGMAAFLRFLGLRLAGRSDHDVMAVAWMSWRYGAPLCIFTAVLLQLGGDWLGAHVYGQHGPWWSALISAFALSLPLRYATNVMRAVLQVRGAFGHAAKIDSVTTFAMGPVLVALGLYLDAPNVAYMSLFAPEMASAAFFWRWIRPLEDTRAEPATR